MDPVGPVLQAASFVAGPGGPRFRLVSEPPAGSPKGTVVALHAFAEEMNKSRRMCARMARLLAASGWRVVQRDLFGCGDSAGEFADASWSAWEDDVRAEVASADRQRPLWLWCTRAGALLAPAALAERPDANLLLWQPVLSGAVHLQQFLRLHAGARIVGSSKAAGAETPAQALKRGAMVEVAGYDIAPALAAGMQSATFGVPAACRGRVVWFELSSLEPAALPAPSLQAIERLRAGGLDVQAQALPGPAFWQTQEIEECEALLARSLADVGGVPAIAGLPDTACAASPA